MEWGVAFVHAIHSGEYATVSCLGNHAETRQLVDDHTRGREAIYCPNNVAMEFAIMGICSFGLTVVNIALILCVGAIFLKVWPLSHLIRKCRSPVVI